MVFMRGLKERNSFLDRRISKYHLAECLVKVHRSESV